MNDATNTIRITCPQCGVVLETEESVANMKVNCPECGAMFVATPMKPVLQIVPEEPQKSRKSPPKGKRKKWGWGLMLGLVLAVSAGVGAKWWSLKRPESIAETETSQSSGEVKTSTTPEKPADANLKSTELVRPSLTLQLMSAHCDKFGGRVAPDILSFSPIVDGVPNQLEGNPVYFLGGSKLLWICHEASSGRGYVFERRSILDIDIKSDAQIEALAKRSIADVFFAMGNYGFSDSHQRAEKAQALLTSAMFASVCYPAPAVFSFQKSDTRFLYLNESGSPSVLEWGQGTNFWFWCHEGEQALRGYAKCLRELRKTLVEYTAIAQDEGLKQYHKTISVKDLPDVYIGRVDQGTREKAILEYEFLVESFRTNVLYRIKEKSTAKGATYFKFMDLKELDEMLSLFSRFETKASTGKAFEPLYCFLSQKKRLQEESQREADRLSRRFEGGSGADAGKKEQQLTFPPIDTQNKEARVELEATAESGGKVVFSVESGPGKIDGATLTFTGTGKVVVRARQWGNDEWMPATATQEVEVTPVPPKPIAPELEAMISALQDVQANRTPANFTKMETAWKALPETWKSKLQSRVIGASCAMYLAKGHPERAAARKALVDEQALWKKVSDPCRDCGSKGKHRERCRVCGGSGVKQVRCSTCQGTGNCSFCHGSGQAGGRLGGRPANCPRCGGSGHCSSCSGGYVVRACADCSGGMVGDFCRTCHGAGRIISKEKCEKMVVANIDKALLICRGVEVPEDGDEEEDDDDDFMW